MGRLYTYRVLGLETRARSSGSTGKDRKRPSPRGRSSGTSHGLPRTAPTWRSTRDDGHIWLLDLVRGGLTRLTSDPGGIYPVWTWDSRHILFASIRDGAQNLFMQAADGTGAATRLTKSPNTQRSTSLSYDDTQLMFYEDSPKTDWDLMELRLGGSHEITPRVHTEAAERNGEISPDGRWLAYEANHSGTFDIYVRPFPNVDGGRSTVSTGGGTQPLWSSDSRELFYRAPSGAVMRVAVGRGATWDASPPAELLKAGYYAGTNTAVARMYDIHPDGSRFLMIKPSGGGSESTPAPTNLVVWQHFDEELKRLLREVTPWPPRSTQRPLRTQR